MKKILVLLILGLFCSIFLSGCTMNFVEKTVNSVDDKQGEILDLKFDLDINSLAYKLPDYTKICIPELRNDCMYNDNCKQNKPTVFVLYDENTKNIYRCDKQPCSSYNTTKEISGFYTNITPKIPNGSIWKISEDNEYVEIISMGLDFIMYTGKCINK